MAHPSPVEPPPSPPGYLPVVPFRYPVLPLQIGAVALVVLLAPALVPLIGAIRGPRPLPLPSSFADLLIALAAIIATVIAHEAVHGLGYRLLGYRVAYGVSLRLMAAYAGAFGQWQRRDHNILVALLPLALSPLLLPLLLGPAPLALAAFAALLFNSAGAVGDLYLAWYLARLPRAALLYDSSPSSMWIALPAPGRQGA